jgi:hypothetical protein
MKNRSAHAPTLPPPPSPRWPALPALAVQPFTADYKASYMGMQANGVMTVWPPRATAATAGATRCRSRTSWPRSEPEHAVRRAGRPPAPAEQP